MTAVIASVDDSAASYSRAQLASAATRLPPIDVAARAIACVMCSCVSFISFPAATVAAKIVTTPGWKPASAGRTCSPMRCPIS
jgi:hypothetical protein